MPSTHHTISLCKIRLKGDIKNVRQKGKLLFIIKKVLKISWNVNRESGGVNKQMHKHGHLIDSKRKHMHDTTLITKI